MAEKIFTVDKFLGLNESADGSTELKLGEASKMENFYITDDYNLKTRPGICRYSDATDSGYSRMWKFISGEYEYVAALRQKGPTSVWQDLIIFRDGEIAFSYPGVFYNVFAYKGNMCVLMADDVAVEYGLVVMRFDAAPDGSIKLSNIGYTYTPLVLSDCNPSGGGKEIEKRNILSRLYYVECVGDGTSTEYVLPSDVEDIKGVTVDGKSSVGGAYNADTHTFTFTAAPREKAQISFLCMIGATEEFLEARNRFLSMPYAESFNGATDTRVFFYGDGTNLCYYSGIPAHGSGFYVPAMNELCVDFSSSPITGMVRHYSRLLAYKPDGVDAITYEPVTLADGSVIAGFYLRPVNRDYGNEAMGQVALVNNHPRTFSGGSIYEWRVSSSNYRDERYAKRVSQKVEKTLAGADLKKIVAYDDVLTKTYYVFLNDDEGTVLVNRYDLDAWSIYKSALTKGVSQALTFEGKLLFLREDGLYCFDPDAVFDEIADEEGNPTTAIECLWESGYMAFGADYKRKYSSNIWVSMLPEHNSDMDITVRTDRRDEYLTKSHGLPLLDFEHINFNLFSFITSTAPRIKRIKIKVKKFVYYKLIFKITKPGARATVLGYDQQVRYSSNVK